MVNVDSLILYIAVDKIDCNEYEDEEGNPYKAIFISNWKEDVDTEISKWNNGLY